MEMQKLHYWQDEKMIGENRLVFETPAGVEVKSTAEAPASKLAEKPKPEDAKKVEAVGAQAAKAADTKEKHALDDTKDGIQAQTDFWVATYPELQPHVEQVNKLNQDWKTNLETWEKKFNTGKNLDTKGGAKKNSEMIALMKAGLDKLKKETPSRENDPQAMADVMIDLFDVSKIPADGQTEFKTLVLDYCTKLINIRQETEKTAQQAITEAELTPEEKAVYEKYGKLDDAAKAAEWKKLKPEDAKKTAALLESALAKMTKAKDKAHEIAGDIQEGGAMGWFVSMIQAILKLFGGLAEKFGIDPKGDKTPEQVERAEEENLFARNPFDAEFVASSWPGHRTAPETKDGGHGSEEHQGVDVAVPEGTAVHYGIKDSEHPAIVKKVAFEAGGAGNYVDILLPNGKDHLLIMHLKEGSIKVKEGEKLGDKKDDSETVIAETGNTGNSTGPHAHLEIRDADNAAKNPLRYFKKWLRKADEKAVDAPKDEDLDTYFAEKKKEATARVASAQTAENKEKSKT